MFIAEIPHSNSCQLHKCQINSELLPIIHCLAWGKWNGGFASVAEMRAAQPSEEPCRLAKEMSNIIWAESIFKVLHGIVLALYTLSPLDSWNRGSSSFRKYQLSDKSRGCLKLRLHLDWDNVIWFYRPNLHLQAAKLLTWEQQRTVDGTTDWNSALAGPVSGSTINLACDTRQVHGIISTPLLIWHRENQCSRPSSPNQLSQYLNSQAISQHVYTLW